MLSVGLTGNIASGKSTVARLFQQWGATVIDADQLVHDLERPGTPVYREIVRAFGEGVVSPDGSLDRAQLRRRISEDPTARERLNAIVHPAVRAARDRLAHEARARGVRVLVNEIPLLFEVLDPSAFDIIVLVDAPVDERLRRLMEHRGLTRADAERLVAAQMPADQKRARSHIVIENGGSRSQLEQAAARAWQAIQERAAAAPDPG